MPTTLPDWAIDLSDTDGCLTTWRVNSDLTISTMDGEVEIARTAGASVTVNADQSITFPCPGCARSITRSQYDGPARPPINSPS